MVIQLFRAEQPRPSGLKTIKQVSKSILVRGQSHRFISILCMKFRQGMKRFSLVAIKIIVKPSRNDELKFTR